VSKLIAQLAMHKQTSVNKIYDPACGSGSLLLQAKKHFDAHIIEDGFFGQEINHTTYNLARMNMFLHNINYDKFNIQLGNTLTDPHFGDDKPFDAIVSNPPYSVKWIGSDDPTLINDDRFAPAGVLAPKSKADFAFVLHALSYLSSKGRAAIVCFPGIFYRGGAEQKIRQYLVDNNYVETVISLAPNLFYGTTIAVNILVLSKHKTDTTTQFIDASGLFKKETNNNVLLDAHIDQIMQVFDSKAERRPLRPVCAVWSSIAANDYNLSVSSYVEAKDTREVVDIAQLNAEAEDHRGPIDQLRQGDRRHRRRDRRRGARHEREELSGPAAGWGGGGVEGAGGSDEFTRQRAPEKGFHRNGEAARHSLRPDLHLLSVSTTKSVIAEASEQLQRMRCRD
jgi:type I restriction enzyme M protein